MTTFGYKKKKENLFVAPFSSPLFPFLFHFSINYSRLTVVCNIIPVLHSTRSRCERVAFKLYELIYSPDPGVL